MNRRFGIAAVLLFAGAAWTAAAAPTVQFRDSANNGNGNDGFEMDLGANGSYDYVTFCVETQEQFQYGTRYEYNVSTAIKFAGGNTPIDFDTPTGHALAYIFSTFHTGGEAAIETLSGLGLVWTDAQWRELVQRTIWNKLYGASINGTFTQPRIDALFSAASGQWNSLGNVRVMNLWDDADTPTGARQDMLIVIPLPSASGLACVGLLGLGAARRRR